MKSSFEVFFTLSICVCPTFEMALEHFHAMLSHGCVGEAVRPFLGLGMEAGSRTPTAWEASQTHRDSLKML